MPVLGGGKTRGRLSSSHTAGYSHRTASPAPVSEAKEKLVVNDRSPSGPFAPRDTSHGTSYSGYASFDDTAAYAATPEQPYAPDTGHLNSSPYDEDPLFGAMPGHEQPAATAMYDTGAYGTVAAPATYDTGTYQTGTYDTGTYSTGTYDTGTYAAYDTAGYDTGAYPTGGYDSGTYDTAGYDTGAYGVTAYGNDPLTGDTGAYSTGGDHTGTPWGSGSYPTVAGIPAQTDPYWAADATTSSGQWDLGGHPEQAPRTDDWSQGGWSQDNSWSQGVENHGYDTGSYDTSAPYDTGSAQYDTGTAPYDTGASPLDTGGWGTTDFAYAPPVEPADPLGSAPTTTTSGTGDWDTGGWQVSTLADGRPGGEEPAHTRPLADERGPAAGPLAPEGPPAEHHDAYAPDAPFAEPALEGDDFVGILADDTDADDAAHPADHDDVPEIPPLTVSPHPVGRGRRRAAKPRRSALLTVAVPSVAVMGVAGIAAASVGNLGEDSDRKGEQAAPDPASVKPSNANSKLDTQLDGVRADAGDFAGRASRTQERLDLKERQETERKRKEAEAARKEAERPKFALPVTQPGLSAYYGQSGVNWLSLHTGIDFPVSYGTPVKAATDGIVTTKYDLSYGNMMIVTAADGTETWYCHLSSSKIRGGEVKAGDTIGYAGSSGKSTGPHLHFEVRPGGGSAIDPLAWFRGKGLDPT